MYMCVHICIYNYICIERNPQPRITDFNSTYNIFMLFSVDEIYILQYALARTKTGTLSKQAAFHKVKLSSFVPGMAEQRLVEFPSPLPQGVFFKNMF